MDWYATITFVSIKGAGRLISWQKYVKYAIRVKQLVLKSATPILKQRESGVLISKELRSSKTDHPGELTCVLAVLKLGKLKEQSR